MAARLQILWINPGAVPELSRQKYQECRAMVCQVPHMIFDMMEARVSMAHFSARLHRNQIGFVRILKRGGIH
jgi:hypothetical protein